MNQIINTWDQNRAAGGDRIYFCYFAADHRGVTPSKWAVCRMKDGKEMQTSAVAPWYDNHKKTFLLMHGGNTPHERRQMALQAAMTWATKKYGARTWVRNRMGDWVETEVNKRFPLRRTQPPPRA